MNLNCFRVYSLDLVISLNFALSFPLLLLCYLFLDKLFARLEHSDAFFNRWYSDHKITDLADTIFYIHDISQLWIIRIYLDIQAITICKYFHFIFSNLHMPYINYFNRTASILDGSWDVYYVLFLGDLFLIVIRWVMRFLRYYANLSLS